MLSKLKSAFRELRSVRLIALLLIGIAIILYTAPYLADAAQCVDRRDAANTYPTALACADEVMPSYLQCLGNAYDRARRDTNLAAIIIALAVTLAAWRPELRHPRRNRAPARARRRSLRNADANAPR